MSEAYSPIVRGFDAETAEQDACRIEHDMSRETFEKLKACWETIAKGERKP
jgi:Mn-dependent DtxR family transcriptional regulator